jgi:hypothetical protein
MHLFWSKKTSLIDDRKKSQGTMGRKGIGHRRKLGKLGSFTPTQKRYSFRPNEVRSGIFERPTCPKLKAVIVGKERYIFDC